MGAGAFLEARSYAAFLAGSSCRCSVREADGFLGGCCECVAVERDGEVVRW
jgi:hypothetical protein